LVEQTNPLSLSFSLSEMFTNDLGWVFNCYLDSNGSGSIEQARDWHTCDIQSGCFHGYNKEYSAYNISIHGLGVYNPSLSKVLHEMIDLLVSGSDLSQHELDRLT
jgi:hypothetical protein